MRSRFFMLLAALLIIPAAARAQSTEIARAAELVDEGKIEDAIALLRKSVSTYSGEPAALVRYELGRSDTDPAVAASELGRAAIQSSSRRAPALLALGELLILQGNGAEAHDHLRDAAAAKMGALSERASYLRGVALHQAGKFSDARNAFADYLVDYLEGSFQVSARIGIALSNEVLGERRLAVEIYKAVTLQHRGFDEEPWLLSRLAELMMKDAPAEAEKYRARVREEYPEYQPEEYASVPPLPSATAMPTPSPVPPAAPVRPADRPSTTRQANQPGPTAGSGPPPVMDKERFAFQVGAFRNRASAENMARDLSGKGYPSEVVSRGDLNVVLAGRYRTQADAMEARPALERIVEARIIIVER